MPDIRHKRGTRAALDALAGAAGLKVGQIYVITDENRLSVALTATTYETYAKQSEAGGGGGASWQRVTLDVPAGQSRFKKVNLISASVTPASVVVCQFFGGTGAAVNEADEVANWSITATPLAGSINFNISCPGPFVGEVEILYKVQ